MLKLQGHLYIYFWTACLIVSHLHTLSIMSDSYRDEIIARTAPIHAIQAQLAEIYAEQKCCRQNLKTPTMMNNVKP
jgi:hypothetical protein